MTKIDRLQLSEAEKAQAKGEIMRSSEFLLSMVPLGQREAYEWLLKKGYGVKSPGGKETYRLSGTYDDAKWDLLENYAVEDIINLLYEIAQVQLGEAYIYLKRKWEESESPSEEEINELLPSNREYEFFPKNVARAFVSFDKKPSGQIEVKWGNAARLFFETLKRGPKEKDIENLSKTLGLKRSDAIKQINERKQELVKLGPAIKAQINSILKKEDVTLGRRAIVITESDDGDLIVEFKF